MSGSRSRIGLFGGSFDPIHRGHVEPVLEVSRAVGLERVVYLPTAQPPHKPDQSLAPALARYCMVELALLEHDRFVVSDFELLQDRPAYTIDTVREFRRRFPESEVHLIVGADSYLELESWRCWRELLAESRLVVLARPGSPLDRSKRSPALEAASAAAEPVWAENRRFGLASSDLRARLAAGESPSAEEMDPAVLQFCRKYALYR